MNFIFLRVTLQCKKGSFRQELLPSSVVVAGLNMSQRKSGYDRKEHDLYETPEWVTSCLMPYIVPLILGNDKWEDFILWEPACGSGKMVRALNAELDWRGISIDVWGSDIEPGEDYQTADFLSETPKCQVDRVLGIITNSPYKHAQAFIERALKRAETNKGFVAMLLRVDFDSAKTRSHLFAECPAWSKKIVLTNRIVWFEGGSSPSFNHCWYVWDWQHEGPATIHYAGK